VYSADGPCAAHTDAHVCTHTPHFIFSYLLDPTTILLLRLSGLSQASVRPPVKKFVCTLVDKYGTQNPSLSPVSASEKDIIKSLLSEITKGWDTVSAPGKHGT